MTTRRLYLTCICFLCFPLHSRCSLIVAKKSKVFGRGVSSNNNVYLIALKVRNHLFTIETQLKSSNSYISSGRITYLNDTFVSSRNILGANHNYFEHMFLFLYIFDWLLIILHKRFFWHFCDYQKIDSPRSYIPPRLLYFHYHKSDFSLMFFNISPSLLPA